MYRIRLSSGEQAVFRTVEELSLAVQSGVVGPSAEVYHVDANRWLPVESHPDYQAVLAVPARAPASEPSVQEPEPPLSLAPIPLSGTTPAPAQPTPSAPATEAQAVQPTPTVEAPPAATEASGTESAKPSSEAAPAAPSPASTGTPQLPPSVFVTRAKKLRDMLALRLGIALAVGTGAGLLIYLAMHSRQSLAVGPSEQHEGMPPGPAAEAPAPVVVAAPVDVPPADRFPSDSAMAELAKATASEEPVAITSPSQAARPRDQYAAGYEDAREELDDALAYVRFSHLFERIRMSSFDSLRATQRTIAAAGNVVRTYRAREVMLEQTVGAMRPVELSVRESFEAGVATRQMLEDADSLYTLLSSQWGRYSLRPDTVVFSNATAAQIWNRVRARLVNNLNLWRDSAQTSAKVTIPRLERALGAPLPPSGRSN